MPIPPAPALQRLLEKGYVLVVADYRAGGTNSMGTFSTSPEPSAFDDGVSIIEYVRSLPFVDGSRIHLWGGSLGANLVLHLISRMPEIRSAVLGSPAPLGFLGMKAQGDLSAPEPRSPAEFMARMTKPDLEVTSRNVAPIKTPILIFVGTADPVFDTVTVLHNALDDGKKSVRMEVYEGGDHFFLADGTRFNTGGLTR
jgi:dipeptidyl aminopeptidase/acylaminoacyl peptidase